MKGKGADRCVCGEIDWLKIEGNPNRVGSNFPICGHCGRTKPTNAWKRNADHAPTERIGRDSLESKPSCSESPEISRSLLKRLTRFLMSFLNRH